jgi:threonine/homoserine/homoserine lactone efflux protein
MSLSAVLIFVAALAVAMASPGPAMVSLVARTLARGGTRGTIGFAAGLVLGDIFWFACAVFGVAALAGAAHEIMTMLKYAGALYLAWLGFALRTAPTEASTALVAPPRAAAWSGLAGGFSLALANAKTMMFYLALLPNLIDLAEMRAATFLELSALLILVYSTVLAAYIFGAARARRLFVSAAARRAVNRGSGAVMVGAAALVAWRA